jgi:glutamyl-Q tRNA(Asp) synthetase
MIVSRFAPSPTGGLHLGHAWSAIQAHDHAKNEGDRFLLRIEDTDVTRSRPEHVAGIIEDLEWLGLGWDAMSVQSERLPLYDAALDRLRDAGLAYPCFCTRAEIAREVAASLHAPHGPDGPLYPGTCRVIDPATRAARMASEAYAWRLDAGEAARRAGPLAWTDELAGTTPVDPQLLGDLVLKGKDRPASYHLAVVVDDAAQGVTHIVRGRDIMPSTHAHRLLQAVLSLPEPRYRHHSLVLDAEGNRLAKRHSAPTLADWRAEGMDGIALVERLRVGELPFGYRLDQA